MHYGTAPRVSRVVRFQPNKRNNIRILDAAVAWCDSHITPSGSKYSHDQVLRARGELLCPARNADFPPESLAPFRFGFALAQAGTSSYPPHWGPPLCTAPAAMSAGANSGP